MPDLPHYQTPHFRQKVICRTGRLAEQGSGMITAFAGSRAEQPASPPFHSRARNVMEASVIEDPESRRLAELTYLGVKAM